MLSDPVITDNLKLSCKAAECFLNIIAIIVTLEIASLEMVNSVMLSGHQLSLKGALLLVFTLTIKIHNCNLFF